MSLDSIRFILADDYAFIRRMVVESLKDMVKIEIVEAENGERALQLLGLDPRSLQRSPKGDVIVLTEARAVPGRLGCLVTDFNMPYYNGLEILKLIRTGKTAMHRRFPVIMLTGFSEIDVMGTALALDVSGFVVKPVSKDGLVKKIHQSLKSEWKLKSVEHYERVKLPDLSLDDARRPAAVAPVKTKGDADELSGVMRIEHVGVGAVLAADVVSERGQILIRKGEVVTEWLKDRLEEVSEMFGIQMVCIKNTSQKDS